MPTTSTLVEDPDRGVVLEALVEGAGPDVVLLPSSMRGAEDFSEVQAHLNAAGFRSIAVNPRLAGRSTGPTEGLTLRDAADDVAVVVRALASPPVHLVGHALGNIVARATATHHPDLFRTVTVMPAGGHNLDRYPTTPAVQAHVGRCHDESLTIEERLEALRICFFAPGNEPPPSWLTGWWPATGWISAAFLATDPATWWRAGGLPMLVVQPLDDAMGPVAAGRETAVELGDQAWYVEVPRSAHALLPEQPAAVAELIATFARDHEWIVRPRAGG